MGSNYTRNFAKKSFDLNSQWELLPGGCFPKQKYNNPAVVDDSPPAAINTALAVGLLSPAETTTHPPLPESVSPVPAGAKPNRAHPHPRGPPRC